MFSYIMVLSMVFVVGVVMGVVGSDPDTNNKVPYKVGKFNTLNHFESAEDSSYEKLEESQKHPKIPAWTHYFLIMFGAFIVVFSYYLGMI